MELLFATGVINAGAELWSLPDDHSKEIEAPLKRGHIKRGAHVPRPLAILGLKVIAAGGDLVVGVLACGGQHSALTLKTAA